MIVMATIKDDLRDNILPDQLRVRSGLERDINILMRRKGVGRQTSAFQCSPPASLAQRGEFCRVWRVRRGGKTRDVSRQGQPGVFEKGCREPTLYRTSACFQCPPGVQGKNTSPEAQSVNEGLDFASGRRHRGMGGQ